MAYKYKTDIKDDINLKEKQKQFTNNSPMFSSSVYYVSR